MKLNRFLRIEPTDIAYSIPKSFSLEKHLGNDWRRAQYPRGSRD